MCLAFSVKHSALSVQPTTLFHQKSTILPKIPLFCRINSYIIMNSPFLKKILPHAIALAVFIIVAVVYCKPALQGKVLSQSDVIEHKGMAQQSEEFKTKHGYYPKWTRVHLADAHHILCYHQKLPLKLSGIFYRTLFIQSYYSFRFSRRVSILTQVLRSMYGPVFCHRWPLLILLLIWIILAVGHNTQMAAIGLCRSL